MFSAAKIACKLKAEQTQVCEVRRIPGLMLVHFREYGPLFLFFSLKVAPGTRDSTIRQPLVTKLMGGW